MNATNEAAATTTTTTAAASNGDGEGSSGMDTIDEADLTATTQTTATPAAAAAAASNGSQSKNATDEVASTTNAAAASNGSQIMNATDEVAATPTTTAAATSNGSQIMNATGFADSTTTTAAPSNGDGEGSPTRSDDGNLDHNSASAAATAAPVSKSGLRVPPVEAPPAVTPSSSPLLPAAASATVGTGNHEANQAPKEKFSCVWSPEDGGSRACEALIRSLLCHDNISSSSSSNGLTGAVSRGKARRILVLGDSTMKRLYGANGRFYRELVLEKADVISGTLHDRFLCGHIGPGRCNLTEQFGLPRPEQWIKPEQFEGPKLYGLDHPFCQDCSGCDTVLVECHPNDANDNIRSSDNNHNSINGSMPSSATIASNSTMGNNNRRMITSTAAAAPEPFGDIELLTYGGFIGMEFARDVELQTPTFRTTQENVANYLSQKWNSEEMLSVWDKPVCLVSGGIHDVMLNVSLAEHKANIEWYLNLLAGPCRFLIWVAATAPATEGYAQTVEGIRAYNAAVREMISDRVPAAVRDATVFVDVFDASIGFPHNDNVHMNATWYAALSDLFGETVFRNCTQI